MSWGNTERLEQNDMIRDIKEEMGIHIGPALVHSIRYSLKSKAY